MSAIYTEIRNIRLHGSKEERDAAVKGLAERVRMLYMQKRLSESLHRTSKVDGRVEPTDVPAKNSKRPLSNNE